MSLQAEMIQKELLGAQMERQLIGKAESLFNKNLEDCTEREVYLLLLSFTKDMTTVTERITGEKKIYYISAEFLIGRLLSNNLINLGIYDRTREILAKYGHDLGRIEECEPEPSLGNGGLGRLAACFLDSIATLGLPGDGIGLNYHFGLFKQKFLDNLQFEEKNDWIEKISWLNESMLSFDVEFNGFSVKSKLYDIDVAGYDNGINRLHLYEKHMNDENPSYNNQKLYAEWSKLADQIDFSIQTKYDTTLNDLWGTAISNYKTGEMTKEEAIEEFYNQVDATYAGEITVNR